MQAPVIKDLVLVGGGHSHIAVLRAFGMRPLPGVRVTLVSRGTETPYSGMLPGLIAGVYTRSEAHIDLAPLARFANARFIRAEVTGFDPSARTVALAGRPAIDYDVLSINSGSTPAVAAAGADAMSVPVKPIDGFLARWEAMLERAAHRDTTLRIAVVGGGAGGVELALAAERRLDSLGIPAALTLYTAEPEILATHAPGARARLARALAERHIAVRTDTRVCAAGDRVSDAAGRPLPCDFALWATDAVAPGWIAAAGVAVDARGFLLVDACLRSVSHADVFGAGDAASMQGEPRPKSGVFAVRQGMPLARNLRRALLGEPLVPYRPQRRFLSLIGTADGSAVASRGRWSAGGPRVWRLKQVIDRRFMRRYQELPPMTPAREEARLPAALARELPPGLRDPAMRCGGCGAKVGADALRAALAGIVGRQRTDIVVGLAAPDDAAVIEVPPGRMVVLTTDGFRPMLDDPYLFGRITANHCLGDIFAMGAQPQAALANVVLPAWPDAKLIGELRQMLIGAVGVLRDNGAELVGGHTGEGAELSLGFAITGHAERDRLLTKRGLSAGARLVLTKALGTGTLLAAHMRGRARGVWVDGAVAAMLESSRDAAAILRAHGATACTDVTGFGLLGHLFEMASAEPVSIDLDLDALPILDGALTTLGAGLRSTLHPANARAAAAMLLDATLAGDARFDVLLDPQTAGGLLAGVPEAGAAACVAALKAAGYTGAALIGRVSVRAAGERLRIGALT